MELSQEPVYGQDNGSKSWPIDRETVRFYWLHIGKQHWVYWLGSIKVSFKICSVINLDVWPLIIEVRVRV